MPELSIDGKWIGKLSYGKGYPIEYAAKTVSFVINILINNDLINGNCEDDITKQLLLTPASIEGIYKNKSIHFIKRYPCFITFDEKGNLKAVPTEPSPEIQYDGRLIKKFFSGKKYFKGNWKISGSFLDGNGLAQYYTVGGNWTMKKSN